jgi:hypothetical protein
MALTEKAPANPQLDDVHIELNSENFSAMQFIIFPCPIQQTEVKVRVVPMFSATSRMLMEEAELKIHILFSWILEGGD